jgi:hypothetical protein
MLACPHKQKGDMSSLHITTQPRRVDSRWIGLMWRSGLQYIRSSPGPDTRIPLSSKGTEFKQPGKRLNAVRFEIRTPHERKKRARVRISIGRDIIPTFRWGRWWSHRRPDERLAEPCFQRGSRSGRRGVPPSAVPGPSDATAFLSLGAPSVFKQLGGQTRPKQAQVADGPHKTRATLAVVD